MLDVEETEDVPTATVGGMGVPVVRINPRFVERHCIHGCLELRAPAGRSPPHAPTREYLAYLIDTVWYEE